jgi:hypothetical protein
MSTITKIVASITLSLLSATAAAVEFKIHTNTGWVGFAAADGWTVLSMQSKMPIAAAVFQIPNREDHHTKDSTNLIIMLFDQASDKARAKFEAPVKQYGATPPVAEKLDQWTVYRQESKQGETLYSVLDAKNSSIADVSVSVRLAWPHLGGNPKTYDSEMTALFQGFIKSIDGGLGTYVPKDGEKIYRPRN